MVISHCQTLYLYHEVIPFVSRVGGRGGGGGGGGGALTFPDSLPIDAALEKGRPTDIGRELCLHHQQNRVL